MVALLDLDRVGNRSRHTGNIISNRPATRKWRRKYLVGWFQCANNGGVARHAAWCVVLRVMHNMLRVVMMVRIRRDRKGEVGSLRCDKEGPAKRWRI
jgi:hypothetical protein